MGGNRLIVRGLTAKARRIIGTPKAKDALERSGVPVRVLRIAAGDSQEKFPRELTVRLKHLILSHHGTLEHGSPKVPMTAEAMLVHSIDMMDTRMHMVLRELKEDRHSPGAWTPYNHTLGRRLYKGGPSGDLFSPGGETFD